MPNAVYGPPGERRRGPFTANTPAVAAMSFPPFKDRYGPYYPGQDCMLNEVRRADKRRLQRHSPLSRQPVPRVGVAFIDDKTPRGHDLAPAPGEV